MSLLNTNQLTPGGRNFNKDYPYIIGNVKDKPSVAVDGVTTSQLNFTGGEIQFDDLPFSLDGLTFDMADLGSLVADDQKFILAAVPGYEEPISQAAAEAADVPYYVTTTGQGETLLHQYIPSAIQAQIDAAGGIKEVQKLVLGGLADQSLVSLYNSYKQAEQRNIDPRQSVGVLKPSKVEFVLIQIREQKNYSDDNYFLELTKNEFLELRAKTPAIKEFKVLSGADAISRYAGSEFVIYSGKSYATEADAINDVSGTPLDLSSGVAATVFSGAAFVRVVEYYVSSNTEISRQGDKPKVIRYLTKRDSSFLGRTQPILLANEPYSLVHGRTHYSPLTRDPAFCALVEVDFTGGNAVIAKEIFESYLD